MFSTPAHWIASGGGIGRFPLAPGTAASLVAALIGGLALWADHRLLTLLAILAAVVGVWAVHETREQGDPGWIVIDEFAGQWIAMLGLAHASFWGCVISFALFRGLDIAKPGPVGWAEREGGAIGVMADDVVAGVIVAALLFVVTNLFPRLIP